MLPLVVLPPPPPQPLRITTIIGEPKNEAYLVVTSSSSASEEAAVPREPAQQHRRDVNVDMELEVNEAHIVAVAGAGDETSNKKSSYYYRYDHR